jgi:hypothetical protein
MPSRYLAAPKPYVGQNHGLAAFVNFTMPTHSRPNAREIIHRSRDSTLGRDYTRMGGSMLRSKILLVDLALIPATILLTSYSSLGQAKGDECRAKPDSSAPAGLHWYYRVDRANNRHCWYLHEQGVRVHSLINAASRSLHTQSDTAEERIWKTPPVTDSPQPENEQNETTAEQPAVDFAARWVDLPRSVDLNAHELVAESSGYAAEHGVDNRQEQLPPALANVSAVNGDVRQNAPKTNFESISLAGAVVLALLLMSEALVRFARTLGWSLLRRRRRADSDRRTESSASALDAHGTIWRGAAGIEPISRTQTGVNELRRLLQRAGTGLRPPQSFAPSRSVLAMSTPIVPELLRVSNRDPSTA